MASRYSYLRFTGAASDPSQQGVNPVLLNTLNAIGQRTGHVIDVISGRRPTDSQYGYSNDPHQRGEAVDAYINGRPIGDVIPLSTFTSAGLQGGNQAGFWNNPKNNDPTGADAEHVQIPGSGVNKSMIYNSGGSATPIVSALKNTTPSQWPASAQLAYQMGIQAGLNPTQAKDMAAVQWGESGFDPNSRNKQGSGAAGLYQLLSAGYVNRANELGGVFNPRANIAAILPSYVSYYKSHPQYVPGAAGAYVEASGEPASYYAQGLSHLSGGPPSPASPTAPVSAPGAGGPSPAAGALGAAPTAATPPIPGALVAALRALAAQPQAPAGGVIPRFAGAPLAGLAARSPIPIFRR